MISFVSKGKTAYSVVLPDCPSPSQKRAADELVKYVKLSTGAELPVKPEKDPETETEIVLGECRGASAAELGNDGFSLYTEGKKIFIVGSARRGTMYGVYGFLEKFLNCRFYAEDAEKVPTFEELSLEDFRITEKPVFDYRNTFWHPNFFPDISAKTHSNASPPRHLDEEHGGTMGYANQFVHTIGVLSEQKMENAWVPTPCLTDETIYQTVLKNAKKWLDENPEAEIISISQNDSGKGCDCPKCTEINEREGSPMGSLLAFVNRFARDIKKDYPNVWVDTLSYLYTRAVPNTLTADDNVVIRLCSIESCFSHPLEECTWQMRPAPGGYFSDVLKKWKYSCKHLYIWDYVTNFAHYLAPFPNFSVLRQNVRFFADNNVKGVLEQGNYQSVSGEFGELRAYLLSKLLWDPYLSEEEYYAHMDDFCSGYYGKGGKYIRRYIDLLQNEVRDVHFGIYEDPVKILPIRYSERPGYQAVCPPVTGDTDWLSFAFGKNCPDTSFLFQAKSLFERAYSEAETPEEKARVEKTSIQILYYEILYLHDIYGANLEANLKAVVPEDKQELALGFAAEQKTAALRVLNRKLYELLKKHGITMISEGKRLPEAPDLDKLPREW